MADEKSGKPDLKARLGRKRFKTGSTKSLKSLKQMKGQKGEEAAAPSPTGAQQPVQPAPQAMQSSQGAPVQGTGPMDSAPAGAPVPVEGGAPAAPAEAAAAPEVVVPAYDRTKKMMWAVATAVALVSIGIGYSCGKSSLQNTMINHAKRDAQKILVDIKKLNKKIQVLGEAFTTPPKDLQGYVQLAQNPNVDDPNLILLSSPYLNYIPPARKRKTFMASLLTFYSYTMLVKEDYADYQRFVNDTLGKQIELVKALDAAKGKSLGEKLQNFLNDMVEKGADKAAKKQKKGGYVVLLNGSNGSALLVPFDPSNAKCPKAKPRCMPNERVFNFNGVAYSFAPDPAKPLNEQKIAYPFDKIAPDAIKVISRYEVQIPLTLYYRMARTKFKRIRSDLESARKQAGKILDILERASKRKDRGLF